MSTLPDSTDRIIDLDEPILVTGGTGFIGTRLLRNLQDWGFRDVRCVVRSAQAIPALEAAVNTGGARPRVRFLAGNLLSPEDCEAVTREAAVIYHLAAGTGTKSHSVAFLNSVVTTRNLLEGALRHGCLRRLVNVSSFAVYTNRDKPRRRVLDESCPTEERAHECRDAYCFAKLKQDELVTRYAKEHGISCVLVRPGVVYGAGKERIHGRVGLDTFGIFLHLGGSNPVPLTHVDNCAEAIALAGMRKGIDGEVFNVVDDDLPSSRRFLRQYKKRVARFRSLYVPRFASYTLCFLWEKYCAWSEGQLPPLYNRKSWAALWKRTNYSNEKTKRMLGWTPRISTPVGLDRYFASCREKLDHA